MRTQNINPGVGGFALSREKYEPIHSAILAALSTRKEGITFAEMVRKVAPRVNKKLFPKRGSVDWYAKVVQLDLEKRGLIQRIPGKAPMRLRRIK